MNEILTSAEAAELLRVTVPTLRGMAKSGDIPAFQIGDDWRFIHEELISCLIKRAQREQQIRKLEHEQSQQTVETIVGQVKRRGRPRKSNLLQVLAVV